MLKKQFCITAAQKEPNFAKLLPEGSIKSFDFVKRGAQNAVLKGCFRTLAV